MPVPERLAYGQSQMLSHNIILHIVLGAGDPENAALEKPPEVFEVDIRLVKDDNFTFVDSLAKCRCFRRIVCTGCFYKNEIRQKGTQIQTQMHFRRRFPPAVFCPIQTVGDQLNRCRINHMDHPLEASRQRTVASALNPKVRTDLIQMSKNFPEQFFRHACVTVPVRVGQTITARGNAIPNFAYQTAMISKRIADVVQPQGMRQLSEDQSQNMTRRAEHPRLPVYSELIGKFRNQISRNQLENLR